MHVILLILGIFSFRRGFIPNSWWKLTGVHFLLKWLIKSSLTFHQSMPSTANSCFQSLRKECKNGKWWLKVITNFFITDRYQHCSGTTLKKLLSHQQVPIPVGSVVEKHLVPSCSLASDLAIIPSVQHVNCSSLGFNEPTCIVKSFAE